MVLGVLANKTTQLVYNVNKLPQRLPLLSMDTKAQLPPLIGTLTVDNVTSNLLLNSSTILPKEDPPETSLKCLSPSPMVPSTIFEMKMVVSVDVHSPAVLLI